MEKTAFSINVQLRPRRHNFTKCLAMVQELVMRYEKADVDLAGLSNDSHQIGMTFRIKVDPPGLVTGRTQSGYMLTKSIFENLFDYLPRYVSAPTEPEKKLAEEFLTRSLPQGDSDL